MLKNYFKIAIRNLLKYKFYSLINIIGLAIGITSFLFIFVYIQDELSYNDYHEKADRIYRVDFKGQIFDQEFDMPECSDPFGPTALADFPEVEQQVRFRTNGSFLVKSDEQNYREEKVTYVDSTFFDVFSLKLLKGDPNTALAEPNTLLITPSIAKKYFGDADPVGKSLILDDEDNFRVTGVIEEIPSNTHFDFDIFLSMASLEESRGNQWTSFNFPTFLVLREGTDPATLEAKFPQFTKNYIGTELEKFLNISYDDFLAQGNRAVFSLMPLKKIHLYSHKQNEMGVNGDIKYVYIFAFIGFFILLLACINFMNLSTARSANRAKEVGMRKVAGANRKHLILQFLGESTIISFLALFIAFGALQIALPYFNELSGKELTLSQLNSPSIWITMLGVALIVGLVAGSYPAFFLSSFQPIKVLKGALSSGIKRSNFRNAMVTFQFAITIILIVGSLVVGKQLRYIQNKKLGFTKEQVLVLNDTHVLDNNLQPFKNELLNNPEILKATISSYLPTPSNRNSSSRFLGRNLSSENMRVIQSFIVDHDYVETMDMNIIDGRNFDRAYPSDSTSVIINQETAVIFGIGDNPLGKEISVPNGPEPEDFTVYKVIGVVENFHFESLREKIGPLMMTLGRSTSKISFRIRTDNIKGLIAAIQNKWDIMAPGQPFDHFFMDDAFNDIYTQESRIGQIVSILTFLAIFIACLGLFGLASFTAEQRTKEIGIRKILGAPVSTLFFLLTSDFAKWVIIANIIALPLAYYAMQKWLQGFEYQAGIGIGSLFFAALIALLIALITVSYQAFRAALSNPVKSLRYE